MYRDILRKTRISRGLLLTKISPELLTALVYNIDELFNSGLMCCFLPKTCQKVQQCGFTTS